MTGCFPGSISDVRGLLVGHFTDPRRPTGCTVILTPQGVVAGVDVRGAAPGTRETELLSPLNAVEQVHAILLAGGSAFGLDAAGGVMRWLDGRVSWVGDRLVLDTGFMVFGLPYPVSKKFGGGILFDRGCASGIACASRISFMPACT